MTELIDTGRTVDIVTLSNELARYKEVEAVGGVAYLASLTEGLPRRPVIEDYIRIVKDKSLLRRLMGICSAAIAKAADQSQDAIGVLDETESQLLEVSQGRPHPGPAAHRHHRPRLLRVHRQSLQAKPRSHGPGHGLYRFRSHDQRLAKGRAHHHRRAALHGQNRARHQHRGECRPSPRFHRGHLQPGNEPRIPLRRMLASQASVDQQKIQKGFFGPREQEKLQAALSQLLVESRIFIDDSAGSTIAEMRAKARRLKQNAGGLDLVMIDYLQLMSATMPGASKKGFENRVQEVSAISRGLKAMAKELQVPVIALSQLSRSNEKRDDKRPMLSDLRESGSIEQDADVVAFIHREAITTATRIIGRRKGRGGDHHRQAAQRPHGHRQMHWNSAFTRFDGVDTHHDSQGGITAPRRTLRLASPSPASLSLIEVS
jgi:replicative DNA helicase